MLTPLPLPRRGRCTRPRGGLACKHHNNEENNKRRRTASDRDSARGNRELDEIRRGSLRVPLQPDLPRSARARPLPHPGPCFDTARPCKTRRSERTASRAASRQSWSGRRRGGRGGRGGGAGRGASGCTAGPAPARQRLGRGTGPVYAVLLAAASHRPWSTYADERGLLLGNDESAGFTVPPGGEGKAGGCRSASSSSSSGRGVVAVLAVLGPP